MLHNTLYGAKEPKFITIFILVLDGRCFPECETIFGAGCQL